MTRDEAREQVARAIHEVQCHGRCEWDGAVDPWHPMRLQLAEAALSVLWPEVERLTRERDEARDEHHTMDELYLYRALYHALAASEWARHGTYPVVKSRRHSDGEPCFGGGWFIVVATLPAGQASNHYPDEQWDWFDVPEVELPPAYDGHTPAQAAERLRDALISGGTR